MNIFYKHQIDHRPHSINLYHNQPFQTGPISTNEQTSESLPTATSNDANKQLEPVVLYTHFSMDQKSDIQYVMTTALSHISFQIINPTFISFQSDPFLLHLIAPCHKTHTNSKEHRQKSFCFKGLRVLQQSNAYFYFRPSQQCRHILREGRVQFQSHLLLRLTNEALCTRVYIRKGAYLGTLQPVLLSKYLKTTNTIYSQPPLTSTIC